MATARPHRAAAIAWRNNEIMYAAKNIYTAVINAETSDAAIHHIRENINYWFKKGTLTDFR